MSKTVERIGKFLAHFMLEKNLNDYDLAKVTKISRGQITNLRNGTGNPTLRTLETIAAALGRQVSDFFKEEVTLSATEKPSAEEQELLRLYRALKPIAKPIVLRDLANYPGNTIERMKAETRPKPKTDINKKTKA